MQDFINPEEIKIQNTVSTECILHYKEVICETIFILFLLLLFHHIAVFWGVFAV